MIVLNPIADASGLANPGQGKHVIAPDDGTLTATSPIWDASYFGYHLLCGHIEQFNGGASEFAISTNGTGSSLVTGPSDRPGSFVHTTGTTTTGRSSRTYQITTGLFFSSTSGVFRYEINATLTSAVSDGTDTYVFRAGVLDSLNGVPTDGVFFEMDSNTDPQIQCVCRQNNTETRVDSGVTLTQGTTYRFICVITNDTQAEFYIGAGGAAPTLVATITTNIPTGTTRQTGFGSVLLKSAGTNSRTFEVFYYVWDLDRVA